MGVGAQKLPSDCHYAVRSRRKTLGGLLLDPADEASRKHLKAYRSDTIEGNKARISGSWNAVNRSNQRICGREMPRSDG